MYILFNSIGGRCDIFFLTQFSNNSNKKKCPPVGSTRSMWSVWVGLDSCDGLGKKFPQRDSCTPLVIT